jgi:3-deoxy-7-phosphoheptulonate synthase
VARAVAALAKAKLPQRLMIDCSHGNSRKDPARQPTVARDLAGQIRGDGRAIVGVMIESHLVAGRQDPVPGGTLTYGQSITDACLGWPDTVPVLRALAEAVRARRKK